MKSFKKRKGITLIALIITIIVLLILAGVSLNLISGSNGILGKAKKSNTAQIQAEMKEQLILALQELQIDKLGKATLGDITQEWADGKLGNYEAKIEDETANDKKIRMKKNGIFVKYIIDLNLKIEETDASGIEVMYQTISVDENNVQLEVTITTIEDKIKQIELPDGTIEKGNGKEQVKINCTIKIEEEFKLIITTENGKRKEETILLKMPQAPVIPEVSLAYPLLTLTGVEGAKNNIEITYDETGDFINYYSVDEGVTWVKYTGAIKIQGGMQKIKAKTECKKCPEIFAESEKEVQKSADDALTELAYDGNIDTYVLYNNYHNPLPGFQIGTGGYSVKFLVDESTWKNRLKVNYTIDYSTGYDRALPCIFLDEEGKEIKRESYPQRGTGTLEEVDTVVIPENTASIIVFCDLPFKLHEVLAFEESLRIGSNIIYPVIYTDMTADTTGNAYVRYDNSVNGKYGWKILDLGTYNEQTKTYSGTKLISTGIPIFWNKAIDIENDWYGDTGTTSERVAYGLIENFSKIPISQLEKGTNVAGGQTYYWEPIENKQPSSEYNADTAAILLTDKAKKISNLTFKELNKLRHGDQYNESLANDTTRVSLENHILCKYSNKADFNYWLATPAQENYMWIMLGWQGTMDTRTWYNIGLRPVITLKDGIKINKVSNGVWGIE